MQASSWGRYRPLRSLLVKAMGWCVPTDGEERLYTSSSVCPQRFGSARTSPKSKSSMDYLYITNRGPVVPISPFRPLAKFFVLDLHEHLCDGSIERWQY
ncbi:hypothetical protein Acr_00g0017640 [Actinidia rufa]|uniref:Uncharacterized protein n=1 Tax=Actinidia rufa TaxID=165716 RepID=A0A7J0DB81_9ERIC|nr:hypothetical protein Acr_00g0017640 [Actinidia rufa]